MSQKGSLLPSPDFSVDPGNYVAGLRPKRDTGYRLEKLSWQGKILVHNYGHGGAGISLSWGCASEVRDLVLSDGTIPNNTPVAVLGGGVMGMTAATLLVEKNFTVTIYSEAFSPHTTSNVAGGQWAPSLVSPPNTTAGHQQFERIMRTSFRAHESRINQEFGVVRRDNYTLELSSTFDKVPRDLIPTPERLAHLPFEKLNRFGYRYRTLLIEPPIFLPRLHKDLQRAGVQFIGRRFTSAAEVYSLSQRVIINCTGLGSRDIWPDPHLKPLRGQLAILSPQPSLQYLFGGHGYLFPRADGVVIGGTQEDTEDPRPDPVTCRGLIAEMKNTFEGTPRASADLPAWYLLDK